jgi:hypothetical protein
MAAQLEEPLSLTVRPMHGNNKVANRAADSKPARWIAAALVEVDNKRAAVTEAVEVTGSAIDKPLAVQAGEIRGPSVVLPEAGAQQKPAVRVAAPVWEVVAAAVGEVAVAVGDGGR